jgi:hypothetical protein
MSCAILDDDGYAGEKQRHIIMPSRAAAVAW